MKRIAVRENLMGSLPIGRAKGFFPHLKGANFSGVGCFFPSVEPKATIAPAMPAARTKLTAIPMYSFTRSQPRGQYTLSAASRRHRPGREAAGVNSTDQSDQRGHRECCGHR